MIKGLNYCSLKGGLEGTCTIDKALEICQKNRFKSLELNFSVAGVINPLLSKEECLLVKKKCQKTNILMNSCSSGMSWEFNPTSLNKRIRLESINLHKKAMCCASVFGAKSFLFVPGIVGSPIASDVVPYEIAVKYAKEAILELLIISKKYDIELCLENVWNGLFLSPIEFRDFIISFNNNYLGSYFDVGNVLGYHQDPVDWILTLSKQIKRVQIKDFKKNIGNLSGFCDLLSGDIKWKEVMSTLYKINYTNTIIAEILPWDFGSVERNSIALDLILKNLRN